MMKIKSLTVALLASLAMAAGFNSCSDDEETSSVANNYTIYQSAVDSKVIANKKHDKAILLVAFGSTWQNSFKAFDKTVEAYKKQFKDCDVYMSFSSAICINPSGFTLSVLPVTKKSPYSRCKLFRARSTAA